MGGGANPEEGVESALYFLPAYAYVDGIPKRELKVKIIED